jgi:circadian clock protein KaiB
MSKIIFKIYVAGLNVRNQELITTFSSVCSEKLKPPQYQVDVIDILKTPFEAEIKKVLATPTIIRERPYPEKRIIGDFRENTKAELALNFLTDDIFN